MKVAGCFLFLTITVNLIIVNATRNCSMVPELGEDEECCIGPDVYDHVLMKQCEDESDLRRLQGGSLACFITECYMKRVGLIESGQVSLPKIKLLIDTQEYLTDALWRDIYKEASAICLQKTYNSDVNKIRESMGKLLNVNASICDPSFLFFSSCTQMEIFKICPESASDDTRACRRMKKYLGDCPDNYIDVIANWAV